MKNKRKTLDQEEGIIPLELEIGTKDRGIEIVGQEKEIVGQARKIVGQEIEIGDQEIEIVGQGIEALKTKNRSQVKKYPEINRDNFQSSKRGLMRNKSDLQEEIKINGKVDPEQEKGQIQEKEITMKGGNQG